jgi:two-component system sensor histidine kinase KdpD
VGERRESDLLDPLSRQAVAERVLVLVMPGPNSQRVLRPAWRSANRVGAELDVLWVHPPGRKLTERGSLVSALVRELPGIDIRIVANPADREQAP